MNQKIEGLSAEDQIQTEEQRNWVRGHYSPETQHLYDTLEGKLSLLETILQENWIEPNETWKLQCLGITFGDALVQKLNLHWVAVEDEYGRDPALHDRGTTIVLFPMTSISKRIEQGETVNVRELFETACLTVAHLRCQLPSDRPR
jgi:hypothetical protein